MGTVCANGWDLIDGDDSFGHIEATIACRELGFSTSISYSRASSYPVGSGIGEVSTLEYILLSEIYTYVRRYPIYVSWTCIALSFQI